MKLRCLLVAALSVAVLAATAVSADAGGASPWLGIYDCFNSNGPYGLYYLHSSRLRGNGTYQQAFDRHNGTLKKPTTGRWTFQRRGSRINFKTGAFKTIYGTWHGPNAAHGKGWYVEKLRKGKGTPAYCYPTKWK